MTENQTVTFLQRLPKQLGHRHRIILETVDISAASIELSMQRIQQLALDVVSRGGDPEFNATERSMFLLEARAIVDRAHNMRAYLRSVQSSIRAGDDIKFDQEACKATSMRNAMDHIAQQIGNMVKKDTALPIYGILTFAWKESSNSIAIINVSGSGFHHAARWRFDESMKPVMSAVCDHFVLRAFDHTINLSLLASLTVILREALNRAAEEQCRKISRENAKPDGPTFEELMEPIIGGSTVIVRGWTPEKE